MIHKFILWLSSLLAVSTIIIPIALTSDVGAINAADFDPGRIIDDALFYDQGGMTGVAQVQSFLDAHVPACDTWGTQPSGYGNLTDAQYAQQVMGWPGPPYVCLNNYYENPSTGQTSFEMGGGAFSGGQSAAQIIYNASQQYGINPKVLLVMIRKESLNLFGDSWPMKSQYAYAMGYACPDSGPNNSANCNSNYAGFYNQVNKAAWQLRYYYTHMGEYNFTPGRWNTIAYSTDPSCGTKNVYIQNNATASLYIYTPYTPNDASLNAYPGTAPCGSYGNRNFWYYWQEWFGTTKIDGNFLRSPDNPTVYLMGDGMKYPISDPNLIAAASRLGTIGYVSDTYLSQTPTGQLLGRFIQSPDGSIYYYDSSIKLPFSSCTLVADYGGNCGSIPTLTQAQIDNFVTGPAISNYMGTTTGKLFYMSGGQKHEVFDTRSLTEAGMSVGALNILTDSSLSSVPYGTPIIRNGVVVRDRQNSSNFYISDSNNLSRLSSSSYTQQTFSALPSGQLDTQSITALSPNPAVIDDVVKDENNNNYFLTANGKVLVPDATNLKGLTIPQLSSQLLSSIPGSAKSATPALVKSVNDSTVYALVNGQKRPLISMGDLSSITNQQLPPILWLSGNYLNTIPTGNIIVGVGRLVKTPSNATVYMTDGYDTLIPMSSFDPAIDLGVLAPIQVISDQILSKYTISNNLLSSYVSCSGTNYIAMSGRLYQLTLSGKTPLTLQDKTCNILPKSPTLPGFVLAPSGTIYQLKSGTLYPISSWSTYQSLIESAGGSTISATYMTLSFFPIGSAL